MEAAGGREPDRPAGADRAGPARGALAGGGVARRQVVADRRGHDDRPQAHRAGADDLDVAPARDDHAIARVPADLDDQRLPLVPRATATGRRQRPRRSQSSHRSRITKMVFFVILVTFVTFVLLPSARFNHSGY